MKKCVIFAVVTFLMAFMISCDNDTTSHNKISDVDDASSDDDSLSENGFGQMKLNPSGNIPLSAAVDVSFSNAAKIIVEVADINTGNDPFKQEYAITETQDKYTVPVLGLFPDYTNSITVKVFDSDDTLLGKKEFEITTAALPDDFPVVTMEGTIDNGWTIVDWSRTPNAEAALVGIALDELGRIRWYTDFPFPAAFPITLALDGNSFYTSNYGDILYHFDFMGNELGEWDISQFGFTEIHHEIYIKSDGNIILAVSKKDTDYIEDRMIEINPTTNQIRATWDMNQLFPDVCDLYYDVPLTSTDTPGTTNDPIHNNGVWYDPDDDSLLMGSERSGIAKITHSGYLKWFLAPYITAYIDDADNDGLSDSLVDGYDPDDMATSVGDFKNDDDTVGAGYIYDRMPIAGKPHEDYSQLDWKYPEFLLTPLDAEGNEITDAAVLNGFKSRDDFKWPFRAHSPQLLKNGNVLVFDNGLGRDFTYPPISPNHYSRVVEYKIVPDETDTYGGTIQQVWEFIFEADPMWYAYSPIVGGATELDNGNILAVSGSIGTSYMPEILANVYGSGPVGALVVEIDKATATELNRLSFERIVNDDHPNTEFSAYRAFRFDLKGILK